MIASEKQSMKHWERRSTSPHKKNIHNASQEILEYMLSDEADIQNMWATAIFKNSLEINRGPLTVIVYELKFDKRMSALHAHGSYIQSI